MRGGVNSTFSEDVIDLTEVRRATNCRQLHGEFEKRAGSQRIHDAAIGSGAAAKGLYQWDAPAGKQVVAIAAGNLYHKLAAATDFTLISSTLSTTKRAWFAPYRIGASIKLMIADGALRSWDGTTLTTSITDAPAAARICVYKLRMMAITGDSKTLYFSKVGNPALWTVADLGGSVDVETYDSEPLQGIVTVGSSLLLCKEDNIARFTGVDTNDIRVDIESEGVSGEVGLIAPNTLCKFEEIAFLLSDRGPYLVSESGVQETGLKIGREFDFANRAVWQNAEAVHHRGRKEIWLSLPAGAEVRNDTTWIYNYRTQTWNGPHVFPFSVLVGARLELADGSESVMVGGNEGFVRNADVRSVGAKDDVLRDGSGGTNVAMDLRFPVLIGGQPDSIKGFREKQSVQADLGTTGSLTAYWSSELHTEGTTITMPTKGAGVRNYLWKFANAKGARIIYGLREATETIVKISGILPAFTLSRKARAGE